MKQLPSEYIGDSLSHGTLRQEDLIPSFMDFLQNVKKICDIQKEVDNVQKEVDELEFEEAPGYSGPYYKNLEDADYILNEDIVYLLDSIAPKFTYFGSTLGDGADFGFWTDEDSLLEHVRDELDTLVQSDSMSLEEIDNELEALQELLRGYL